jgi:hypothetical protein
MSNKWYYTSRGKLSEVIIDPVSKEVVKQFRGFADQVKNKRSIKNRGSHTHSFLRELECLRRLKGCDNFPQLIDHDEEDLWIKMSYCGTPYPCTPPRPHRPELVDQSRHIIDTLAKVDIKYPYRRTFKSNDVFYTYLSAGNINVDEDKLYLIDFESALPVGSRYCQYFEQSFLDQFKKDYTTAEFKRLFEDFLVPTGDKLNSKAYAKMENKRHMSTNSPKVNATWNNYQYNPVGDNIDERIKSFGLRSYGGGDKSMIDIGANHGRFGVEMADQFQEIHCVEPFAAQPDPLPANMTWHKMGFREFTEKNHRKFDLVLTFACTLQIADIDLMSENEIAKAHADLVAPGGTLIYESQKQFKRERNQIHVSKIVANLKHFMGSPLTIKKGRSPRGGGREFYVFNRAG